MHVGKGFRMDTSKMNSDCFIFRLRFFLVGLILLLPMSSLGTTFPITVTDAFQNKLHVVKKPQRVVSLVPYITEMLVSFGQEQEQPVDNT